MYGDPITIQSFDYATYLIFDKNPRNIMELDPDSDDQSYILRHEPENVNHHFCSLLLKLKSLQDPIPLQPKMMAYILTYKLIKFGL